MILAWLVTINFFAISFTMLAAYLLHHNRVAAPLAAASFFLGLAYLSTQIPLEFFPHEIVTQAWVANVVSESLSYVAFTYLAIVILLARFPTVPLYYALFVLLIGYFVVFNAAVFFEEPTPLPANEFNFRSGNHDFQRTLLTDLVPFILGSMWFLTWGDFVLTTVRLHKKYRIEVLTLIFGIVLFSLSLPLLNVTNNPRLVTLLAIFAVIGLTLSLITVWTISVGHRLSQTNEPTQPR